jgi:hypothetical protein
LHLAVEDVRERVTVMHIELPVDAFKVLVHGADRYLELGCDR